MPDLLLDAPSDPETLVPPASTEEASTPEMVHHSETEEAEETTEEQETVENTVREEPPSTEPQGEQEEGALAEQQDENSGEGEEEEGKEDRQNGGDEEDQRAESAPQVEEEVTVEENKVGKETQPMPNSDNPVVVSTDITAQEASVEQTERAQQEVTEGEERSCVPCTCQSFFSNYISHAPSRRRNRPCSLPVSELETVIASACGEPETPRSHYIRIHHLLHSLPSAQHRAPSQEEEETGDTSTTQDTTSTSPTLKNSKEEEGQENEEEEDTTQSPSQVHQLASRC